MISKMFKDEIGEHLIDSIEEPHIKDSGNRREFSTGAVRDIQEGKGRCDLMPLDVIADYIYERRPSDDVHTIRFISMFVETGDLKHLYTALDYFSIQNYERDSSLYCDMFLDVAKQFEEGAKKYGECNWQKGIPTNCYIDSAVRHYLKFMRGDTDEPHDRAFVWNILCCIWTCKHKPELNVYKEKNKNDKT